MRIVRMGMFLLGCVVMAFSFFTLGVAAQDFGDIFRDMHNVALTNPLLGKTILEAAFFATALIAILCLVGIVSGSIVILFSIFFSDKRLVQIGQGFRLSSRF